MATPSRIEGDQTFAGDVTFTGQTTLGAGTVTDAMVNAAAAIDADKLQHRHVINYAQVDGTDVISAIQLAYIATAGVTVRDIDVRPTTAPTGGDKAFTVDVMKATDGSSSFGTLLDSVITINSSSVDETLQGGTLISSPVLVNGDGLRIVIATSGSTGSQGQGFVVTITLDENAA